MRNIRSLSLQILRSMMLAGICSVLLLTVSGLLSDRLIGEYFDGSGLQEKMTAHRIESFAEYVRSNGIAASDSEELQRWCGEQPMILMEIFRGNVLYFNSDYTEEEQLSELNVEANVYEWYSCYNVPFADGPADVFIFSDESYILKTWIAIGSVLLAGALFIAIVMSGIRRTIRYIYQLCDEIQIMGSGDLEHPVTVRGEGELCLLARELDQLRTALLCHRQTEQDLYRRNSEMITGLSHDLRTPLTKLQLYTEIVRSGRYKDERQMRGYLNMIHEKGDQIKEISDRLLRYSISRGEAGTDIAETGTEIAKKGTEIAKKGTEIAETGTEI